LQHFLPESLEKQRGRYEINRLSISHGKPAQDNPVGTAHLLQLRQLQNYNTWIEEIYCTRTCLPSYKAQILPLMHAQLCKINDQGKSVHTELK
jgi:hypothetical protein